MTMKKGFGIGAWRARSPSKNSSPAFPDWQRIRKSSFIVLDPKRVVLPVRQSEFFRKGTEIEKLWREAWKPGKRPDPLSSVQNDRHRKLKREGAQSPLPTAPAPGGSRR
jgi:hypothetical protein